MRSAYPVGAALSGGLDLSSIACTAAQLLAQAGKSPLHTFSAVFPSVPISDERPYIDAAVARGGIESHPFNADEISPLYENDQLLRLIDDFYTGGNLHITWLSCEMAQKEGARVFLHGFDGDTTVSHGFYLMKEMALAGNWDEFADTVAKISSEFVAFPEYKASNVVRIFGYPALEELAQQGAWSKVLGSIEPLHSKLGIPRRKILRTYVLRPLIPSPLLRLWRKRPRRSKSRALVVNGVRIAPIFATILNSEFAERVDLYKHRHASDDYVSFDSEKEEHYYRLTSGTMSRVLELIDLTGAAFGMELRYPFNDKRLIEFCYAIPATQKLHQGWSRYILRGAMEGILPSEIQWRAAKSNIGPGFATTFRKYESGLINEVVVQHPEVLAPYVNSQRLQEAYQHYVVDELGQDMDHIHLWLGTKLYLWLRSIKMK